MFKHVHDLKTGRVERIPLSAEEVQQLERERQAAQVEMEQREQAQQARQQALAEARARAAAHRVTPEEIDAATSVTALQTIIAKQQAVIEWLILENETLQL